MHFGMSSGFSIIALKKVLIKEKLKYTEEERESYTDLRCLSLSSVLMNS